MDGLTSHMVLQKGDLHIGFSCQEVPSHDTMRSLILGDLNLKTAWFWLPSTASCLYGEVSVLESVGFRNESCISIPRVNPPGYGF